MKGYDDPKNEAESGNFIAVEHGGL